MVRTSAARAWARAPSLTSTSLAFPPPRGRPFARALAALVALLPLTASAEDAQALEEELARELEAELSSPATTPQGPSSLLPEISLVGTFAGAWFSDAPSPRLEAHEPFHRGFQLQELELGFRSNIDPYLRADVFLALHLGGVEVEQAYVTTLALPANLQLRAGQFYAPFGRFNQLHYLEVTPFADMPLVNRRFFGGEQLRGVGAELSFLFPLPFYLELRAAVQTAGNPLSYGVEAEAIQKARDLLGVARLTASFDLAERLNLLGGVSYANGPNATGGIGRTDEFRTQVYGADLQLRLRDPASRAYTALQGEWALRRATVPGGGYREGGAYLWLVRRFDAHWEAAIRGDLMGLPSGRTFGHPEATHAEEHVHLRQALAHDHGHDHGHGGGLPDSLRPFAQRRVGASISYYPSEFQRIRLQANYDFLPDGRRGIQEYFLQYQFVIGSHGAHVF